MRKSMSPLWWSDSNQTTSGNPGAVQVAKPARRTAYRQMRDSGARVLDAMRFETIVNGCETMLARTTNAATMRQCLESRHVIMQTKTNKEFWKALGGV